MENPGQRNPLHLIAAREPVDLARFEFEEEQVAVPTRYPTAAPE
ncbi:hypothetical protein ACIHCQ_39455 [Streptomyces sp. NPDC052236]